jgi:hypothetical protein
MATEDDVRRLALALAGGREVSQYVIEGKPIAWPYFERDRTRRKLTWHGGVWAIRCPLEEKEMLIEAAPDIYFDDDYYRTFPAVLVRLDRIDQAELAAMLARARELQAPKPRRRSPGERTGGSPPGG